ncbi:MAG: DUF547 domain-containing protein [Candidatus Binatia bacterium]
MPSLFFSFVLVSFLAVPHAVSAAVDHALWNALLARYVDDYGRVAYRDLQAKDQATFESYLDVLAQAQTETMNEPEEKAFWINAYNAVIVNGVLQGYTAEGFLGRKRLFSWFTARVAGKDRTPDEIEHQILRKKFHDPRIHFAIVCASSSCPRLRREAYMPERLDAQLDAATQAFLNDPARNQIDAGGVALSRIFDWFAGDFKTNSGSVVAFVRRFVSEEKKARLNLKDSNLHYLDYNWTLNAQDGQRVS